MAKARILQDVKPESVQRMLNTLGTQEAVARKLGVTQGSLSLYMRKHGFKKVERWERNISQEAKS
jgi:predicted transcriptional regulator